MNATDILNPLAREADRLRLRRRRNLVKAIKAIGVLLGINTLRRHVLLKGPQLSLLIVALELVAAGQLVRLAVHGASLLLLLVVGKPGALFLARRGAGVDEEGDVAHAEGLEGGDGSADDGGVALDVAPDHLGRELPGEVIGLEKRRDDDGSLDGDGADTRDVRMGECEERGGTYSPPVANKRPKEIF